MITFITSPRFFFSFLAEDVPTKNEIVCWCKLCMDGQMLTLTLRMSMSEQTSVNLSNSWICMNDPVVRDLVEHPEVNLTWSVDFLFHVYNPTLLFFPFIFYFSSFLSSLQDFLGQMFCTLGEIVGSPASRLEKPLGWVGVQANFRKGKMPPDSKCDWGTLDSAKRGERAEKMTLTQMQLLISVPSLGQ